MRSRDAGAGAETTTVSARLTLRKAECNVAMEGIMTETNTGSVEQAPVAETCDICGYDMTNFNCELTCTNCGFRRDCTDP